jgi:hypothetical protein
MSDAHVADRFDGVAYHEAGHAVSAIRLGGTLNYEGVTIDGRWYCGGRFQVGRTIAEHIVLPYTLAGDCAEFEFVGETEPFVSLGQVADALRNARSGVPYSDLECAMATLRDTNPHTTDDELFERYKMYAEATYEMLHEPLVARAVTMLAAELLSKGHLGAEEVMRIYLRATTRRFRRPRNPLGTTHARSGSPR